MDVGSLVQGGEVMTTETMPQEQPTFRPYIRPVPDTLAGLTLLAIQCDLIWKDRVIPPTIGFLMCWRAAPPVAQWRM